MDIRRVVWALLALALVGGAAACGGDDDDVVLDVPEAPSQGNDHIHSPNVKTKPPLALPPPGRYAYDVSGPGSGGGEATLTVENLAAEYHQRWRFDRPGATSAAPSETLDLVFEFDGVRVKSRTLSLPGAGGPVALEFTAPDKPVMFVPYFKVPGGASTTDLTSADRCHALNSEITVPEPKANIPVGGATYDAYHVQMVSTLSPAQGAPAGCPAITFRSTDKLWLDLPTGVPVRAVLQGGEGDEITTDVRSTKPS